MKKFLVWFICYMIPIGLYVAFTAYANPIATVTPHPWAFMFLSTFHSLLVGVSLASFGKYRRERREEKEMIQRMHEARIVRDEFMDKKLKELGIEFRIQ